ncbi:hypothetical protein L6R50_21340 [Myxococcota bacterium]|nr:hypothetical protein [Myxococcota bacterium]
MIDTEHRDVPVCPHCGHEHARFCLVPLDEPGDYSVGGGDPWAPVPCPACGALYQVTAHVTVTFSTADWPSRKET